MWICEYLISDSGAGIIVFNAIKLERERERMKRQECEKSYSTEWFGNLRAAEKAPTKTDPKK